MLRLRVVTEQQQRRERRMQFRVRVLRAPKSVRRHERQDEQKVTILRGEKKKNVEYEGLSRTLRGW